MILFDLFEFGYVEWMILEGKKSASPSDGIIFLDDSWLYEFPGSSESALLNGEKKWVPAKGSPSFSSEVDK